MKKTRGVKMASPHLQLPLGFQKADPGDLKRVMDFLDAHAAAGTPIFLSDVFSRFSAPPDAWPGPRIARTISCLFSERMISCACNGNAFLPGHSSIFLETPDQWDRIQVFSRKRLASGELDTVVGACRRIFGMDCPPDQDELIVFIDGCLKQWTASLAVFGRLVETGQYPGAADIRDCLSFIRQWPAVSDPYEKILAIRDRIPAMASFYRTFVRLKDFYKTGLLRWDSWRKSLEKFAQFQSEIQDHPEAAAALSRLHHVLQMQSPWDDLHGMDDAISRIRPVYDRIREDQGVRLQQNTLLQITRMIETISELLDRIHARDAVRNMALVELQKIRKAIENDKPGDHISKQREIAEEAFEKAQDIVFSQS